MGDPANGPYPQDAVSSKVGYVLRSHLLPAYRKGQFVQHNYCGVKNIDGEKLTLTDVTVLYPTMLVAATGWSNDTSFLPGGTPAGEYYALVASANAKPMYLRFYDQNHPGVFYVSMANGFMTYTENASFLSQCIAQILRGQWTPPPRELMEKNCREVVMHHIALPGLLQNDLEDAGFQGLRTKNIR